METKETLLGYDLKEEITADSNWAEDRKEKYLLIQNKHKPLSVDERVCSNLKINDLEKNYLNLLNELEFFKKPAGKRLAKRGELVAITILNTKETKDIVQKYFMKTEVKAYSKKSTWKLLGYDVCDKGRVSLLTNFDHKKMGVLNLFKKWGNYLNNNHLFDKLNYSYLFKDFAESLYPGDKPFFIFGIYKSRPLSYSNAYLNTI